MAVERGPLVYTAEFADNGGRVTNLLLPDNAALTPQKRPDLLGGVTVITGQATAYRTRQEKTVTEDRAADAHPVLRVGPPRKRRDGGLARARAGQGAAGARTDARVEIEGVELRGRQEPPGPERAVRTDRLERPHGDLLPLVAEEGHHRVGAVRLPGRGHGVRDVRLLVRRHGPGRVPGSPRAGASSTSRQTSGCPSRRATRSA